VAVQFVTLNIPGPRVRGPSMFEFRKKGSSMFEFRGCYPSWRGRRAIGGTAYPRSGTCAEISKRKPVAVQFVTLNIPGPRVRGPSMFEFRKKGSSMFEFRGCYPSWRGRRAIGGTAYPRSGTRNRGIDAEQHRNSGCGNATNGIAGKIIQK
jgi:hypothetical protein